MRKRPSEVGNSQVGLKRWLLEAKNRLPQLVPKGNNHAMEISEALDMDLIF